MSKYGVFSGLYFPVFGLNRDQKKIPYLDTFHAINVSIRIQIRMFTEMDSSKIHIYIIKLFLKWKWHSIVALQFPGISTKTFSLNNIAGRLLPEGAFYRCPQKVYLLKRIPQNSQETPVPHYLFK